jgi:hypothetical protein
MGAQDLDFQAWDTFNVTGGKAHISAELEQAPKK